VTSIVTQTLSVSSVKQTPGSSLSKVKLAPPPVFAVGATLGVVPTHIPDLSIQPVCTALLPVNTVLKQINVVRHIIDGDGSCMHHAVAHQAGFISKSSRGDRATSNLLRKIVWKMMDE